MRRSRRCTTSTASAIRCGRTTCRARAISAAAAISGPAAACACWREDFAARPGSRQRLADRRRRDRSATTRAAARDARACPPRRSSSPRPDGRRLSEAERGLLADAACVPTVSLWARRPMRFGRGPAPPPEARRRRPLLLHAQRDPARADDGGARSRALSWRRSPARASGVGRRRFVLAAGGLENAAPAARSREQAGIGNGRDLVGRYFMDHPRAVFGARALRAGRRLPLMRGWPLQRRQGPARHRRSRPRPQRARRPPEPLPDPRGGGLGLRRAALSGGGRGRQGAAPARACGRPSRARQGPPGAAVEGFIYLLSPKEILPHGLCGWRRWRAAGCARAQGRALHRGLLLRAAAASRRAGSRWPGADRLGLHRLVLDWRIGDSVRQSRAAAAASCSAGRSSSAGSAALEPGDRRARATPTPRTTWAPPG